MADSWAFVIGVETYQDPAVPPALLAESDAGGFARVLGQLGFEPSRQVVLLGSQATKTAVESKLRKLLKAPPTGEAFYLFYSGHAFAQADEAYLTCFDSQTDDLAQTSVTLRTVLDVVKACGCRRVALFLDARSGLPAGEVSPGLPAGPLEEACAGGRVCFASCRPGEQSHASAALKHGVWAYHLLEALGGKAPLALEEGRTVTAQSLETYLEKEVPRTLRTTFREARGQTPVTYGEPGPGFVVADLAALREQGQANSDPRLQSLKRGALRSESTARVKGLRGYRKFHKLPDRVSASSQKWVADLAEEDIKFDVDTYYAAVREYLGYRRRDVEAGYERGSGYVRTPDFDYAVSVAQAPDDPASVVWRREVSGIRRPEAVLGRPFQRAFGELFDTLVFEFENPFDLATWVDRVEEDGPRGVKVRCASDCSSCDVSVPGFAGLIRLWPNRVEVQGGGKGPGSKGLVEAFLQFQDLFTDRHDPRALPLAQKS